MSTWFSRAKLPHFVYRIYAADGRLLYVGATMNMEQRYRHHRYSALWWREVGFWRISGPYLGVVRARAAEAQAIRDENPVYNNLRPDPALWRDHTLTEFAA